MRVRIAIDGGALAVKSSQGVYTVIKDGDTHTIELEGKEVVLIHSTEHDPNLPTMAEEVATLPPGVLVVPEPTEAPEAATEPLPDASA